MLLGELFGRCAFEEIVPHILREYPEHESQLPYYKEAFDILLHMEYAENGAAIPVEWVQEKDEEPYIYIGDCEGITGSLTSANAWKSPTTCIFPMPNWRRGACGALLSMAIRPTTEAILTANRIIFTRNRRSGSKCASLSTTRASREANSENTSGERTASRLLWRRGRPSIAGNGAVTAPKGCAIIVRTGESSG